MSKNTHSFPHLESEINELLLKNAVGRVCLLECRASDAVEALLKAHLSPAAFDVLRSFHRDQDKAMGYNGLTFLESLDDLGNPDGIAELQRTLRRLTKERWSA